VSTARSRLRLALAGVLAASLAGCALPVRPNRGEPAAGRPALARAAAAAALGRYLGANRALAGKWDPGLVAAVETDGRYAVEQAELRMAALSDPANRHKPAPFTVAGASYLVPRLDGYPKWFVVSATETTKGAARLPVLMVFVRKRAVDPWRVSTSVVLDKGQRVPALATDKEGYAVAVRLNDAAPTLPPGAVASAHAGFLNARLKGAPAGQLKVDESTRNLVQRATNDRKAFTLGRVSHRLAPAAFPPVALRTRQGGALVLYSERLSSEFVLTAAGARISTGVWHALGVPDPVFHALTLVELLQFATVVPPRGGGAAEPIANSSGLVEASGG